MEPIRPTRPVSPVLGAWVERRRRHLAAQLAAAEEERWEDLEELVAEADDDDMPPVAALTPGDREHVRGLLEEVASLTHKLARAKERLRQTLDDVPNDADDGRIRRPGSERGGRLDGYL